MTQKNLETNLNLSENKSLKWELLTVPYNEMIECGNEMLFFIKIYTWTYMFLYY